MEQVLQKHTAFFGCHYTFFLPLIIFLSGMSLFIEKLVIFHQKQFLKTKKEFYFSFYTNALIVL